MRQTIQLQAQTIDQNKEKSKKLTQNLWVMKKKVDIYEKTNKEANRISQKSKAISKGKSEVGKEKRIVLD